MAIILKMLVTFVMVAIIITSTIGQEDGFSMLCPTPLNETICGVVFCIADVNCLEEQICCPTCSGHRSGGSACAYPKKPCSFTRIVPATEGTDQQILLGFQCSASMILENCDILFAHQPPPRSTARQMKDYSRLTLTPFHSNQTIQLKLVVIDDTIVEDTETILLTATNNNNCPQLPEFSTSTTVTINDDDTVTCSLPTQAVTVMEGANVNASIIVECDAEVEDIGFMLDIVVTEVTASASSDYLITATSIPIPTLVTTFSIEIPIINDDVSEDPESFTIQIDDIVLPSYFSRTSATNFIDSTVTVTIVDEDSPDSVTKVHRAKLMNVTDILLSGNATTEEIQHAAEQVVDAAANEEFLAKDPANVELLIDSLEAITGAESPTAEVTEPVIRIVNNLMEVDEEILTEGPSKGGRIVTALEEQVATLQTNEGNFSAVLDNVGVTAVKIERKNLGSTLVFANVFLDGNLSTTEGDLWNNNTRIFADGDAISVNQTVASIAVPTAILDMLINAGVEQMEIPVSFIIYGNDVLFTPSRETLNLKEEEIDSSATFHERIVSRVISSIIQDGGEYVSELPPTSTVITKFLIDEAKGDEETVDAQECVYWSYDETTREGYWSKDGCTRLPDEDNRIVCSCRRLASFAVLIRVHKGPLRDQQTLVFITLIGSTISGICLCLCLVTFLSLSSYRSKQPTHIHINLCISLLGFYIAFLLSSVATSNQITCAVASAAIHFFCLATVAWMSAEAVNLYFLFVKLQRTGVRYFVPIACFLAYGIPAVCTILVALLDKKSNFQNADYCFIHPGLALFFGFLAEVAILFMANFVIFVWMSRKMMCRPVLVSNTRENARRAEIIKRIRHGILFWFVLGLSWLFGVLAVLDPATLIFDYLYCICIALQGVIIFLLLCVANPEFREVFTRCRKTDTGYSGRSTGVTSSSPQSYSTNTLRNQNHYDLPMIDLSDE